MSIFKSKPWWSNADQHVGETIEGLQNHSCLKVDKFNSHSESDCLVVGADTHLKIYKPTNEQTDCHTLLETELDNVVLQIETGKFILNSEDRQILVLHPNSYSIYQLHREEGHTDAGEQNTLKAILKHTFTRRAHSLTCGPFGNIKTRDFICIQGLDGSLSFFDQDTFLFMYICSDVIIPGPIAFIGSSDAFVICKATWVLEIHSYQQLREFSELKTPQNKSNVPQWIYNAGEEITSIQVIQTSNNFSSVIALGERYLCCFQDNGLMKYTIKFDYIPICFYAYLIGWYYEPGARLLIMIASDDSKLYIYEGTKLVWSCDLLYTAISISRCFLKYLPGGIVSLSATGVVTVSYLGTEPDLNANAAPMINDSSTLEDIQAELETVEESLQKILNGKKDGNGEQFPAVNKILQIKADVGQPTQNLFQQFTQNNNEGLHLLMCPVVIMLTCHDPKLIQSVQITYVCDPPFAFSESTICLDGINGTEIVEAQIFLSNEADIPNPNASVLFTVIDASGQINVMIYGVTLPLSLYCYPTDIVLENGIAIHVQTNHVCTDLTEIFTDFSKEDLLKYGNHHTFTFVYRTTKKTVTVKASSAQYAIEANDYPEITCILQHFVGKISDYCKRNNKEFTFKLKCDQKCTKLMIHSFLKNIEVHAKDRMKLKGLEDELSVLQKQFTVVQKRLLVQYGSLPPGDCDPLEFLMKDTHRRLMQTVHDIIQCRETVCRASSTLTSIGQLIIYIIKNNITDEFKVKLIEEMLSLSTPYELYQEWEEAVTQALFYIVNNVFQKTEKDREKLAPVTEQGILSQINLKRFLKQIKIVLEEMFAEFTISEQKDIIKDKENRVMRIEEFVEVL